MGEQFGSPNVTIGFSKDNVTIVFVLITLQLQASSMPWKAAWFVNAISTKNNQSKGLGLVLSHCLLRV